MKKKTVTYFVLVAAGIALFLLTGIWRGLFTASDSVSLFKALCDCFTVPGIIYLCLGLLLWCGNGGTFDMLGYGTKMFFSVFSSKRKGEKESFYEYRTRKQKSPRPVAPFLVTGTAFLAAGIVFLIVFYNV